MPSLIFLLVFLPLDEAISTSSPTPFWSKLTNGSTSKILFSIFIVTAFFFSALTVSEIFEDYIKNQKIKNVANKLLNIFAIIMPLITIFGIYNLS